MTSTPIETDGGTLVASSKNVSAPSLRVDGVTAAELDARIERDLYHHHHQRVQSPIRVVNPTLSEPQKEDNDPPCHSSDHFTSEDKRQGPIHLNVKVKNELHSDDDDQSMIMDFNEPSLLHQLIEEQQDVQQESHHHGLTLYTHPHEAPSNTIHIHNDLDPQSMTTRTKAAVQSFRGKEGERKTDLHNVLVLADWVMQDIVQDMEFRRKWLNMYYGPHFDPAAVIARFGSLLFF